MSIVECQMEESLQAWGFALRATTPQVAFGYDPTGRSIFFKMTEFNYSTLDVGRSTCPQCP